MTLRVRIILTLAPLLLLIAGLGGAGAVLLYRLGGRIDLILRENYDSVIAMERLNEAVERIDSSFQFALAGREEEAVRQYRAEWPNYQAALDKERANVTLPGEPEAVTELDAVSTRYRGAGDSFFARTGDPARRDLYFGPAGKTGLLADFRSIKAVSARILRMNQQNMEDAGRDARETAQASLFWFGAGLAAAVAAGLLLAGYAVRSVLQPITAVTRSAQAIGAGDLDQVVPVLSSDELGRLADSFNTMAARLREFRHSQKARLMRTQRTSQATIDSFPDPVLVLDTAGRPEMANPAARGLFGLDPRSPDSSKSGTEPVWQPPPALRGPVERALRNEGDYLPEGFDEVVPLSVGGGDRYFLPRVLSIRDPEGAGLGAAVLLADVTRFRLLDAVKTDLVATASHELKTPLTSLRMAVHLLLEEAAGPLTAKQTELLLDARENSERLLAVIENLLSLTRLEEGRELLELRLEAPASLLRAVADDVRARAEEKGVALAVELADDLPAVSVDAARFSVALRNLLENAVTYTNPGGRVTLSASAADGKVMLAVVDTGIGIPPEDVPRIFDRFFRVPGRSRGPGTGLGLAITREIVIVHGGHISCESRLGEGTAFRIALPSAGPGPATSAA